MAKIDFSKPAEQIINLIRGMNPWPVAFTAFGNMKIKVYSAKKAGKSSAPAGEVLAGKSLVVPAGMAAQWSFARFSLWARDA